MQHLKVILIGTVVILIVLLALLPLRWKIAEVQIRPKVGRPKAQTPSLPPEVGKSKAQRPPPPPEVGKSKAQRPPPPPEVGKSKA